jgi:cellulose synthase/poly-beta-1,6-N-acetylglucosamine synthase-like glycosyltransferase
LPDEAPLVSVVVPTNGGNLKCLSKCIEGVLKKTDYPRIELVVVANNVKSEEANRYFHILSANQCTKVLWYPDSFNFSEHAGVVLGLGGVAGHVSRSLPRGSRGYQDRARLVQNFSAVTAACMVMRRSVFEEVGGFDVNLAVAYNDVDLCLRVREAGYRILWTPYAEMYHMERVSRGSDHASENLRRYMKEKEYMLLKWGDALASDPYYNPNLSLLGGNFEVSFSPRLNSKPWLLRKVQ